MSAENKKSITVIEKGFKLKNYFREIHFQRYLFVVIPWRDMVVRYQQAFLGILWALLRPLLNVALFAFIFGKIAHLPSNNISYPLFVFAAILPWNYFVNALQTSIMAMPTSRDLIFRIYFPRILLPISHLLVNLIDWFVGLLVFLPWLFFSGNSSLETIYLAPLLMMLTIVLTSGLSFCFSLLNAKYHDVQLVLPFILQMGLFLSPVGYSYELVPDSLKIFYLFNPLVGIINGFRYAFFGIKSPDLGLSLGVSALLSLTVFFVGFFVFARNEKKLSEVL